jgi:very-short-patch-repair endonuclease
MNRLNQAKFLRSHQTEAEQRLWYHLRAHRFMGLKFKGQKPMGRYIVDFICRERRLIVEVDGGQHAEQIEYDRERDTWLQERGYRVLRVWNNEVMQHLDGVLERIRLLAVSLSPPAPLPHSGEGSEADTEAGEGGEIDAYSRAMQGVIRD